MSKDMWVKTVKKERDVTFQKGELTVQEGDDLVEGYSKGITVTSFLTKIRSDGTVAMFWEMQLNNLRLKKKIPFTGMLTSMLFLMKEGYLLLIIQVLIKGIKLFTHVLESLWLKNWKRL